MKEMIFCMWMMLAFTYTVTKNNTWLDTLIGTIIVVVLPIIFIFWNELGMLG